MSQAEPTPLFETPAAAGTAPKPRLGDTVTVDGREFTLWSPGPLAKTWWGIAGSGHAVVSVDPAGAWEVVAFDADLAHRIDQGTVIARSGANFSMRPTAEVHARGCVHDVTAIMCGPITTAERNAFAQGRPVARTLWRQDHRRTHLDLADCLDVRAVAAAA